MKCFPGEALVDVAGRGLTPMAALRTGDMVLVESKPSALSYASVLGFLHATPTFPGRAQRTHFLTIVHSEGQLRVSANHIIFLSSDGSGSARSDKTAGDAKIGDFLFVQASNGDDRTVIAQVLSVKRSTGQLGMFAPLTAAGSIVVDGVVVSNYAVPSSRVRLPHNLAHAVFHPVRLYHSCGLRWLLQPLWTRLCDGVDEGNRPWVCKGDGVDLQLGGDELHPWITVVQSFFGLGRLLEKV